MEDQPFPGLLRTENLGPEELAEVLRAAVVDQQGEGASDPLESDPCSRHIPSARHRKPSHRLAF